ncbi:SsrA-binding protein SmpB [Catalinimonas sp. 4WD22]|jgi:SsrA-binding protein|uniref:SsrA-binding protein SmpB n=1 Tax=Catalinimonas locisalis TaxID=3133978 RepID=UPI003100FB8D
MANNDKQRFSNKININNRKARYEYHFLDKYVAGIQLTGTEIKSIREGKVNLQEGYCYMRKGELFVKQMHISPYKQGTHYNHESDRERKLLLKKKELDKIESKTNEKGLTLVPTRLFINDRGLAKLEIALAKGKKLYDKRDDIKKKDVKRELDRMKI